MIKMRTLAGVTVAGALALAPLAPAAAAAPAAARTRVFNACTSPHYRPTKYVFTCADGYTGMKNAGYGSWTAARATGTATYYYNTCSPDCVSGKTKYRHVTFTLFDVKQSAKYGPLFTKARVRWTGGSKTFDLVTRPL